MHHSRLLHTYTKATKNGLTSSCCGMSCMMSFCGHWSVFLFRGKMAALNCGDKITHLLLQVESIVFDWLLTDFPLGWHALDMAENASVWWLNPWKRLWASVGIHAQRKVWHKKKRRIVWKWGWRTPGRANGKYLKYWLYDQPSWQLLMLPNVHLRLFVIVLVLLACVFIWIVPLKKCVFGETKKKSCFHVWFLSISFLKTHSLSCSPEKAHSDPRARMPLLLLGHINCCFCMGAICHSNHTCPQQQQRPELVGKKGRDSGSREVVEGENAAGIFFFHGGWRWTL